MARVRRDIDSRFRDMSQRELTDYIHKMGKVANTRLRELEKTKHKKIYKASASYRYVEKQAKVEREQGHPYIYGVAKDGSFKFNTATRNVDIRSLMERATQISRFLSARSSTVTGVQAIYKQSFDTWKADHQEQGDISFSEWSEIFSEGILRNFLDQYGSEKFHELTQKSHDYKMSSEELANVLYSAGFRENTDFYKRENPDRMISIEVIYDELEKARKGQR